VEPEEVAAPSSVRRADPIRAELDRAKSIYDAEARRLKKELLDELQKKKETVGSKGITSEVARIEAERKALEDRDELPKSVPTTLYQKATGQTRASLERAFVEAREIYTREGQDDAAATVEKEYHAFLATAADSPADRVLRGRGLIRNGTFYVLPEAESSVFKKAEASRDRVSATQRVSDSSHRHPRKRCLDCPTG
jgi:hypothetical protein